MAPSDVVIALNSAMGDSGAFRAVSYPYLRAYWNSEGIKRGRLR